MYHPYNDEYPNYGREPMRPGGGQHNASVLQHEGNGEPMGAPPHLARSPMGGGQPIDPYDPFGEQTMRKQSGNPYAPRETTYMPDTRIECKPQYLYSPWAIFRWVQLGIGLLVMGLCTVTCNAAGMNWPACTVYINEFGRVAEGMGYVVFAGYLSMILTIVVIVMYCVNGHRALEGAILAAERGAYAFCVILQFTLAIAVSYYASAAGDSGELYDLSRTMLGGIQPNWIAAAVFAWINFLLHLADLVGQCALGYPSVRHVNC